MGWKRTKSPSSSRFDYPSVAKARDHIILELQRMGIPDYIVVISTNIPLRRDGLPYSNGQHHPVDVGAAVYFKINDLPRVLACDRWSTVGDNLWSIAKTIEATRAIERWGAVTMEQAFAGYAALPHRTGPSCWETLGTTTQATEAQIMTAWRTKAQNAHPDKEGGSHEQMNALNEAKDIALSTVRNR